MHFGRHWYIPKNPVDILWYCNTAKALGADGLHIDPFHIELAKDLKQLKNFAEKNNMYIELGACGTSINDLLPYIEASESLGAKLLRTFVGGNCLDGRRITKRRTEEAVKNLKTSLPAAKKHGVKLAIENHGDIFIEDMKSILKIDSDYLGVCLDSGNFAFTGENPLDAVELFNKRIFCTHLKDVCEQSVFPDAKPFNTVNEPVHFCALGEGCLQLEEILLKLEMFGMENITIEICSPYIKSKTESELLAFEEENVKKSIDYLLTLNNK